MVNRRPTPELIAARKWEIRRRYERHAKVGRRTRSMAAIRLAELTRWLHDTNGAGVELEAGDPSYRMVRIMAHHLGALADAPRRITRWCDTYAPWISPRDLERLISEVTDCPIKYTAETLAWKIRLKDETRTRLKITTIGAYDVTKEQRQARAKAKRAARDAIRRPRKPSAQKPWIAAGISRATWYRQRKP